MSLETIRRTLHQHPGVSGDEHFAHDTIVDFLTPLHPAALHTHVGGYGVVAYWGESQQPTVAIRADIDALPSGHRCGHDGHTATLLRVAEMVTQHTPDGRGVLLIFQPEEETGAGAQKVIDSGVLDGYNIRCVLAQHNIPGYPLGDVLLTDNTFAAASSGVVYHLTGRPTHASTPEMGVNPGLATARIIEGMQRVADRSVHTIDGFRQATLIAVELGSRAFGTSAGTADICFTLRAFTNATMQRLLDEAHNLVRREAACEGLEVSLQLVEPFRATENTKAVVDTLRGTAAKLQFHTTDLTTPFRWSEDFANFLQRYPGALFGMGAGVDHCELHHPDYVFPDALIEPTARMLLSAALEIPIE